MNPVTGMFSASISLIFVGLFWISPLWAQERVVLSQEQRDHVASRGIVRYCVDPDWAPFEYIDAAGEHRGIGADLLRLAAGRVGLTLQVHSTPTWEASLAASQRGDCDLLSLLNRTPARESWLHFTAPLLIDENVIITREDHPYVVSLDRFDGKRLAVPAGTAVEEWVRRDFPRLQLILTQTENEAFQLVSDRRADMTIRSLIVAAYTIRQDGWFNLRISGMQADYVNLLRIGVRRDDPMLHALLDAGVRSISQSEREAIINRHINVVRHEVEVIEKSIFWPLLGVLLVVLLTSGFWILRQRALNQRLSQLNLLLEKAATTDQLTGLNNRARLMLCFEEDSQRALRGGRPYSLALFDIDHFKHVNDSRGHVIGDQVLREVAALMIRNGRGSDRLGRWGGEEFMLLFHDSDVQAAMEAAERIRADVAAHAFSHGEGVTLSVGVAQWKAGESLVQLMDRADKALYRAKQEGRNRVCPEQRHESGR
ncbi:diguanylate cyclase [Ectothiorhodospira lacustris]|uniref:diguanylate cyclase n=1 Tax=Ectothiorhodospira lacustris TaxID=2899127 RepID=UPI001EE78192|nr:diguanylate cyclase [Ectothiorhodospira lacustris]MCG5509757.1 diguanylate cyclase [Ectothiorhodospira lacustris]MCG5522329.1 diguanylate cyclase [Ectothiorhodospira lacustris]